MPGRSTSRGVRSDSQTLRSQIEEPKEAVQANPRTIEGRFETLNGRLGDLREEQKKFPELENRLQTLELQQNLDQSTYEFLLSRLNQARITEAAARSCVDIVDPALGANPMQPRGRMNIFRGALLGLILGIPAAFYVGYPDRTVRTRSDVEALLGIPVLGIIPRLRPVQDEVEEERADTRRNVPLVVALDPLREPGLTNLLVGDVGPREAVRPNVLPNMDVLPSGPFPPNPSERVTTQTMKRLLEEFQGKYSQFVLDSPPVLAVTDASATAVHTDGVVLVLRSGETEQRTGERSVDQLRRLGVRVFGAVLNEVSTATTEESYYLQYYYSYEPGKTGGVGRLREGISKARFW